MLYRLEFDGFIDEALTLAGFNERERRSLWGAGATAEGLLYGHEQGLPAGEAAAYALAAGSMIRLAGGELSAPLATRIIKAVRQLAFEHPLSPGLRRALAQVDADRREWIECHHETEAAIARRKMLASAAAPDPQLPGFQAMLDRALHWRAEPRGRENVGR